MEVYVVPSPPSSPIPSPPHPAPSAMHAGARTVLTKLQKKKKMTKIVDTLEDAMKDFINTHFKSAVVMMIGDKDFGPLLYLIKCKWRSVHPTIFVLKEGWKCNAILDIAHMVCNTVQHEKEPDLTEPCKNVPWNTDTRVISECTKAVVLLRFLSAQEPLDDTVATTSVSKKVEAHLMHVLMLIKQKTPEYSMVSSNIKRIATTSQY